MSNENILKGIAAKILDGFNDDLKDEIAHISPVYSTYFQYHVVKTLYKKKALTETQTNNLFEYVKSIPYETAYQFWYIFNHFNPKLSEEWYHCSKEISEYIYSVIKSTIIRGDYPKFFCVSGVLNMVKGGKKCPIQQQQQ